MDAHSSADMGHGVLGRRTGKLHRNTRHRAALCHMLSCFQITAVPGCTGKIFCDVFDG